MLYWLKDTGMAQCVGHKRVGCIIEYVENKPQLSSSIAEEVESRDEVKASVTGESLVTSEIRKRKRLGRSELREMKAAMRVKERQCSSYSSRQSKHEPKKLKGVERWSIER